jgi:GDP-4-dehydro-6-deoxy-D-mannose reductase
VNGPILVTGASGFAGSHLVQHLSTTHAVVGWARSAPPAEIASLARWQPIDLLDRNAVNDAIGGLKPSAIVHCAGLPQVAESWGDTAAPLAANALGTHRLLEAIRLAGHSCRIVVAGSAHVYAPSPAPIAEDHRLEPASPYALSKLAQEQLALKAASEDGLQIIVTRSFNHTGPRQQPSFVAPSIARQIALIERGELEPVIRVGNLDAQRDLLDVRDTVRAYAALLGAGTPGTVYNVASGVGRPVGALLDALVSRARVPIRIETDPQRMRANDIPVLIGDATRLRNATGWRPEIPFEQTLDDLLAYWRDQPVR